MSKLGLVLLTSHVRWALPFIAVSLTSVAVIGAIAVTPQMATPNEVSELPVQVTRAPQQTGRNSGRVTTPAQNSPSASKVSPSTAPKPPALAPGSTTESGLPNRDGLDLTLYHDGYRVNVSESATPIDVSVMQPSVDSNLQTDFESDTPMHTPTATAAPAPTIKPTVLPTVPEVTPSSSAKPSAAPISTTEPENPTLPKPTASDSGTTVPPINPTFVPGPDDPVQPSVEPPVPTRTVPMRTIMPMPSSGTRPSVSPMPEKPVIPKPSVEPEPSVVPSATFEPSITPIPSADPVVPDEPVPTELPPVTPEPNPIDSREVEAGLECALAGNSKVLKMSFTPPQGQSVYGATAMVLDEHERQIPGLVFKTNGGRLRLQSNLKVDDSATCVVTWREFSVRKTVVRKNLHGHDDRAVPESDRPMYVLIPS